MIGFWSRLFASHLQEEIVYLRKQVEHERDRAERAVDELLRVRIQSGPLAAPRPLEPAESIVERLLSNTEWADAGNAAI